MSVDDPSGGKAGDAPEPTRRSDLNTMARALRADWPIPEPVRRQLLQQAIDICDPGTKRGKRASPRLVLSALKVISLYGNLTIKQQALDLAREQLDLKKGTGQQLSLADIAAEAEAAAEAHQPAERPAELTEGIS